MECKVVGMDIAKSEVHIFTITEGGKASQKKLRRSQVLAYFGNHQKVLIGIESCAGGHYWARKLSELGHEVKLINPRHVKTFVKGNSNEFTGAQAIYDAASQPNLRSVPIKTVEQQDIQAVYRIRQELVKRRTGLVNQIRAMLYEYGITLPRGINQARKRLPEILDDAENGLSSLGHELVAECYERLLALDEELKGEDRRILRLHENNQIGNPRGAGPGIEQAVATTVKSSSNFSPGYRLLGQAGKAVAVQR